MQIPYSDKVFYEALGLKCGIEMHRQLDTTHKLFCRCPIRPYSEAYDAEILRHMRPTLSELGEYDPTALMEFKTRKEIIYRLNRDTVCTYEMDDAPPFGLNRDALDRAIVLSMMLNLNLVDELHIARKQYLDGSIPTGFQRTAIVGINGWIKVDGRRIGIRQLGLEEDACREVSDHGHRRTYLTDRLSIPLIEIVTEAEMHTPMDAARVGNAIRRLCHLSSVVRTGHGRARQDVNVSITGGDRVEIKGVSSLRQLPALVHFEALRQKALLDLREAARARGIGPDAFDTVVDISAEARRLSHPVLRTPWSGGIVARSIVLRGCTGLLMFPTGPDRTFATEISDRVKVIACLDRMPNIAHSDDSSFFGISSLFDETRRLAQAGPQDAVVVVCGPAIDVQTGINEVRIRLTEALSHVPRETRRSLASGATCFERMLPGPDRMYPDTDLPPIVILDDRFARARSRVPEALWDKEERFLAQGLSRDQVGRLFTMDAFARYECAVHRVRVRPSILAYLLLDWIPFLARRGRDVYTLTAEALVELLAGDGEECIEQKEAAARVARAVGYEPGFVRKADPRAQDRRTQA
jgi:glutamyl-tRNA(Gln) amidotransferase subunit E